MTQLPDGRHSIPISNSDAKCLIENWVEEVSMGTDRQNIVLSIRQLIDSDSCSVSVGVGTPLIARLGN